MMMMFVTRPNLNMAMMTRTITIMIMMMMMMMTDQVEGVVDIRRLSGSLRPKLGDGLTDLTRLWLDKPLDKTEQTSNWETRPLDPDQVRGV
jgi:ribonuclease D